MLPQDRFYDKSTQPPGHAPELPAPPTTPQAQASGSPSLLVM